jgi:pyruvate dehydrogenase E2 component (dihydrolipoamide acetyltransferase)
MPTEVVLPRLGLTQDEGTIVRWLKREGAPVAKGEPLFEVMTDKATLEVEAPAGGVLLRILIDEGGTVPVATPIAVIGEPGESLAATAASAPAAAAGAQAPQPASAASAPAVPQVAVPQVAAAGGPSGRVRISPRARALAERHGVDPATLRGSGPGGRIIERDVQGALAAAARPPAAPSTAAARDRPVAVARMRSLIAARMLESLRSTAQLTLMAETDVEELVRFRREVGPEFERREGVHLTYTDLTVRAAAVALRDHPAMNARWEGEDVRRLRGIHIGVAVALDEGLVVPVVRDADRLPLGRLSAAIRDFSERARAGRLRPDEMQGGTFTVTNLGTYGVDAFTPVLNPPEAGILGVGRIRRRPVAAEDRLEIRSTTILSLTFDHRVVDGAPAAMFLQRVGYLLEHPAVLLLP